MPAVIDRNTTESLPEIHAFRKSKLSHAPLTRQFTYVTHVKQLQSSGESLGSLLQRSSVAYQSFEELKDDSQSRDGGDNPADAYNNKGTTLHTSTLEDMEQQNDHYYFAILAEQAQRYDEMFFHVK